MTPLRPSHRAAVTLLALAFAAAACTGTGGGAGATPTDAPAPATPGPATPSIAPSDPGAPSPSGGASAEPTAAPSVAPSAPAVALDQAWATAPLVDVATGETFRIADHAGSVIIIEPMAIWCSNCRAQQRAVQTALEQLPAERVVYIVLDVDPNEAASSLAVYRERNGFSGRYAIAGRDVARALAAEFGDQVLNPPSTPMIAIATDGGVTLAPFGHKSPDEVVALAEAHGA